MNAVTNLATQADYKVADISLAEWGRKEISIAEQEKHQRLLAAVAAATN